MRRQVINGYMRLTNAELDLLIELCERETSRLMGHKRRHPSSVVTDARADAAVALRRKLLDQFVSRQAEAQRKAAPKDAD